MSDKIEFEEVTVKVPKNFMRLLEGENYFGRSKEEFWADVVSARLFSSDVEFHWSHEGIYVS